MAHIREYDSREARSIQRKANLEIRDCIDEKMPVVMHKRIVKLTLLQRNRRGCQNLTCGEHRSGYSLSCQHQKERYMESSKMLSSVGVVSCSKHPEMLYLSTSWIPTICLPQAVTHKNIQPTNFDLIPPLP